MSWQDLRVVSETLWDLQEFRKAEANRLRAANTDPDFAGSLLEHYEKAEKEVARRMRDVYRQTVPDGIREWQTFEKGIGEHLLARLLGIVGHPRLATPHHWAPGEDVKRVLVDDEPFDRKVSQLWSYCGHGDPARKRHSGMSQAEAFAPGNPRAKSLTWNLACACIKTDGHYREVYDKRRALTESREHAAECVRCGPSGRPAKAGSLWPKAHQHADALRIVGKEILRDLWIAAK